MHAEDTMAHGLPASANPNGTGVDSSVAATLDAGFIERKIASHSGNCSSEASYPYTCGTTHNEAAAVSANILHSGAARTLHRKITTTAPTNTPTVQRVSIPKLVVSP